MATGAVRAPARSAIGWIGQVLVWLGLLTALAVLAVAVVVPRVAGATPYTVLTSSMAPGMPPGTLVVIRPVAAQEIGLGSVITYQLESGRPTVVTHRVVEVRQSVGGEISFVTQGDANAVPDAEPVLPVQVRGERWYSVPYLGFVNNVLTGSQRQLVLYGVVSLLLAYAAFMFAGAARDRVRHQRSTRREEAEVQ